MKTITSAALAQTTGTFTGKVTSVFVSISNMVTAALLAGTPNVQVEYESVLPTDRALGVKIASGGVPATGSIHPPVAGVVHHK